MDYNSFKNPANELIHPANSFRKSCSSINVGYMGNGRVLRESHSFTDGVQENYRLHHQQDRDEDGHSDKDSTKENTVFYIWTKQINSFEPFMVFEEMLTFQGKRYSQSEIAPIWKKDCRMWLWKTRQPGIQKKVYRSNIVRTIKKRKFKSLSITKMATCTSSSLITLKTRADLLSIVLVKLSKLKLV